MNEARRRRKKSCSPNTTTINPPTRLTNTTNINFDKILNAIFPSPVLLFSLSLSRTQSLVHKPASGYENISNIICFLSLFRKPNKRKPPSSQRQFAIPKDKVFLSPVIISAFTPSGGRECGRLGSSYGI